MYVWSLLWCLFSLAICVELVVFHKEGNNNNRL